MKRLISSLLSILLLLGGACASVELTAVNVGKGDAVILRVDNYTALIDTGKSKAWEKLAEAFDRLQIEALDAVFLTHTDKDHVGGLKDLRKSGVPIAALYASKYYPECEPEKHPAVKQGEKLGVEPVFLGAGDVIPLGETGARLIVLAPEKEIPENEDDNSLVMMLESKDGRILLTGDMELMEEQLLLQSGADLKCDVLKVPHHGADTACTKEFANACQAPIAIISTDSEEKPGTPSPDVLENLRQSGSTIYTTQESNLGVRVRLDNSKVEAEYI